MNKGKEIQTLKKSQSLHDQAYNIFLEGAKYLDTLKSQLGVDPSFMGQQSGLMFMEDKQVFLSTAFNNSLLL